MELFPAAVFNPPKASWARTARVTAAGRSVERLPFTIRRVHTEADLVKAVKIRHVAYARHGAASAHTLAQPEAADHDEGAVVLLAESRLDGSTMGSIRIRTNLHHPLAVEASRVLPDWLRGKRLLEATHLGIGGGRAGHLVKAALLKACHLYCEDNAIDWSVATIRHPIDRLVARMLFVDVFPKHEPMPLSHMGDSPHRIMALENATLQTRWSRVRHPLLNFFFNTHHPDIDIGPTAPQTHTTPRGLSIEHRSERCDFALA